MKLARYPLTLAMALCMFPAAGLTQQVSEDVRAVALRWLLTSCEPGSPLENELKRVGQPLEAVFLEALEKGPDGQQVSEVEKAAEKRFERRQQSLKTGEGLGLSREDVEAARKVSREEFGAREKNNFVLRYKSQAAAGLGVVGGDRAKTVLRGIAADEKSPLRTSAQQALARLQPQKKR